MFKLDKNLENDCFEIQNLDLSKVLLMNNANFLWIILVPMQENLSDLTDLSFLDQIKLLEEINLISQILKENHKPDKLNIASLGNVVKQLHIHIIARYKNDKAFPKPVFGFETEKYNEKKAQEIILFFQEKINQKINLKKEILYRSIHRGCKETDHLIGNFAKAKIAEFDNENLLIFKDLISEDDLEIYDWIMGAKKPTEKYKNLIENIRIFHNL